MTSDIKYGAVIFTRDHRRLGKFYEAVCRLTVTFSDDQIMVLASETFELVIHLIPGAYIAGKPPATREDCHIKLFFPVENLAATRVLAADYGGQLRPQSAEWEARERGFRACDAADPDGNVVQFREVIS